MLNEAILSFFVVMPAVAAVVLARDLRHPLARRMMAWGGLAATGLAVVAVLPMLLCEGTLLTEYTGCPGGAGLDAALTGAQPAVRAAAFAYVLVGPPLAAGIWLADRLAARRGPPASER